MISKIKFIEKSNPRQVSYPDKKNPNEMVHKVSMQFVLEDGARGEVLADSVDQWNIGDEVDYKATENQYGKKLWLNKPGAFSGGASKSYSPKPKFDDKQRDAAVAVSYAKDCYIHGKILFDEIEDYAKKFLGIIGNIKDQL